MPETDVISFKQRERRGREMRRYAVLLRRFCYVNIRKQFTSEFAVRTHFVTLAVGRAAPRQQSERECGGEKNNQRIFQHFNYIFEFIKFSSIHVGHCVTHIALGPRCMHTHARPNADDYASSPPSARHKCN